MMRRVAVVAVVAGVALLAFACSKPDVKPEHADSTTRAASVVAVAPTRCPATGLWAECSVMYRLERAGVAPRADSSSSSPEEKALTGTPLVLKIGVSARLEVFLYPDSAARIADGKKLDRNELVDGVRTQTIKRERTLIESGNLIGLLTSINAHQRERVSDALMAGAPQPDKK
jgi:hypothetical protein